MRHGSPLAPSRCRQNLGPVCYHERIRCPGYTHRDTLAVPVLMPRQPRRAMVQAGTLLERSAMANGHAMPFGIVLQHARAAAHLTQEQLATRAGLSLDAVAALERGEQRTPRMTTVHQLAAALALSDTERAT